LRKGVKNLKAIHIIAFILLVIGGLNWGLVGAFHFNLVMKIFGSISWLENLIYILVGLAALWELFTHRTNCRTCTTKAMSNNAPQM